MSSRPVSQRQAKAMQRPRGPRACLLSIGAETYEVVDFRDGGRKVWRLELVPVEPGDEFERVAQALVDAQRATK